MADPQHLPAVVIALPAGIDMAGAGRAGRRLGFAVTPAVTTVIAGMTATRFGDSPGISMLVRAHAQAVAHQARLRLVVPPAAVLRAVRLAGVGDLLATYPSLSQDQGQGQRRARSDHRPRRGGAAQVTPVPGCPGARPAARRQAATRQQAARLTAAAMSGHRR